MDIAGANDQTNQILSLNEEWNSRAHSSNQGGINQMNTTIKNAQAKQSLLKGYDEGSATLEGVSTGLTGAKVYGNAKNFDSEVAGFGRGKGASGYLASQGQIVKGRMAQGKQTLKVAGGLMEAEDTAKSGAELGLTQTKTLPVWQAGGQTQQFGADATKIADTTEQGKAVAKASGGLLSVEKGTAEGGVAGGLIKKAGKFVSDMPEGQLGAVADIGGKALGVFSAGKGLYEDIGEHAWKTDTGAQKVANVGDIVAGGLDAISVAIPMLAPVGAIASGISAMLDIGAQADTEKASEGTARKTLASSGSQVAGQTAPSLSSAGLVAKQQLSAY